MCQCHLLLLGVARVCDFSFKFFFAPLIQSKTDKKLIRSHKCAYDPQKRVHKLSTKTIGTKSSLSDETNCVHHNKSSQHIVCWIDKKNIDGRHHHHYCSFRAAFFFVFCLITHIFTRCARAIFPRQIAVPRAHTHIQTEFHHFQHKNHSADAAAAY